MYRRVHEQTRPRVGADVYRRPLLPPSLRCRACPNCTTGPPSGPSSPPPTVRPSAPPPSPRPAWRTAHPTRRRATRRACRPPKPSRCCCGRGTRPLHAPWRRGTRTRRPSCWLWWRRTVGRGSGARTEGCERGSVHSLPPLCRDRGGERGRPDCASIDRHARFGAPACRQNLGAGECPEATWLLLFFWSVRMAQCQSVSHFVRSWLASSREDQQPTPASCRRDGCGAHRGPQFFFPLGQSEDELANAEDLASKPAAFRPRDGQGAPPSHLSLNGPAS